ncbi:MAG: hypothetical protein HYV63_22355 [Candidatus Schekmanbacteria bacterium]|nr:hypothetical protein [Candidatus Schekmanbacteria bacterium]
MSPGIWIGIVFVGVTAMLWAEYRQRFGGVCAAKIVASSAFLVCAVGMAPNATPYVCALLVALALSWFGDVFLLSGREAVFACGLASFAAAHLAFVAAFIALGVSLPHLFVAAVPLAIVALVVMRWLLPYVGARLQSPVAGYILIVTAMAATAAGAYGGGAGRSRLLLAALLFFVSDLAVARHRFVRRGFANKAWGAPTYYLAQVLFALSAGLQ